MDQRYQSGFLFIYFASCMSPTRSGYNKLGLKPIEPLQDHLIRAQQQPIRDEKKDDGAGAPIKMLLKESYTRQRNNGQIHTDPSTTSHRRGILIKRPCKPPQGIGKF
jgi:hypothetical protein